MARAVKTEKVRTEKGKGGDRIGLPKGFDLDDPKLPESIEAAAMTSGGYPYEKRLKREDFEQQLVILQLEVVKLQQHALAAGERIVVLFEGRDAAGKGTCIKYFSEHLNPRNCRVVALTKPSDVERGQWYFQRYIAQLPAAGQIVLFDRSWYNRAGVERVMGFCTPEQHAAFLREAPQLEGLLVRDGVRLFKLYLDLGREMQLKRFHERRHDPLKRWKISDIDIAAMSRFDDYTAARDEMLRFTHTSSAPWSVLLANDQRRLRLEAIRTVLTGVDYAGKDAKAIGAADGSIVLTAGNAGTRT